MNHEERAKLEDRIFDLSNLDMSDIEAMSDDALIDWMTRHELAKQAQAVEAEQIKPEREPVPRSRERAPRVKRIQSVKTGETFVEKNGKLYRRETWTSFDMLGNESERAVDIACGQRVHIDGRLVSASIALHWVRTGEWVARVPKPPKAPAKPFRAVVRDRVAGRTIHLGCFATAEERKQAIHEWRVKVAGPTPYAAIVWHEGKAKHLGYFATAEQRDAAVFAWKLGLNKNT